MPLTAHRCFASHTVAERACESCKVPEVYGKWTSCNRDGEHKFAATGGMVPKFYESKTFKNNPVKRLIGFEVEVSGCTDGAAVSEYVQSIGGGICQDCHFEINTPPANGDELIRQTKALSEKIRAAGAVAHSNAGLHTHVDCRDLDYNSIRKVCVLYGKVEGALYSIIDPRRAHNTCGTSWAKPVGGAALVDMMSNPLTAKKNVCKFIFGDESRIRQRARFDKSPPEGGDRYLGLNLWSWFCRGTIEFRMHHGTTKWQKMIPWGMLLGNMVEIAHGRGDREIASWPVGKAGLLALCPKKTKEVDVAAWVNERWDYFASKRKEPSKPLF